MHIADEKAQESICALASAMKFATSEQRYETTGIKS
jgi:hypothetical protein